MKFILNKDKLTIEDTDLELMKSGSIKYYTAEVEYDNSWDDLEISAIIIRKNNDKGIERAVINNQIYIDQDMFGSYSIGFIGYKVENNEKIYQISTNLEKKYFKQGAGEIETDNTEELPTPTEWEIYYAQIRELVNNAPKIPSGGTTGQVLKKKTDDDYDCIWDEVDVPTKTSELINDSGFIDDTYHDNTKVDKVNGKGLSTNDYTTTEKTKLAGLENYDDTELSRRITTAESNIESLETNKVNVSDIINDLTHTDTDKPLSAYMGKELQRQIDEKQGGLTAGDGIDITDNVISTDNIIWKEW